MEKIGNVNKKGYETHTHTHTDYEGWVKRRRKLGKWVPEKVHY
jgi:hypothetical protein